MEGNFETEQKYLKAKKRVKDIKGFYIHLSLYVTIIPIIIITNLVFVPTYHFFWYSVLGWGIGIFFHWLGVFGFQKMGFGKDWEEKKIKEFMNKN